MIRVEPMDEVLISNESTVTISKEEYEKLVRDSERFNILRAVANSDIIEHEVKHQFLIHLT